MVETIENILTSEMKRIKSTRKQCNNLNREEGFRESCEIVKTLD